MNKFIFMKKENNEIVYIETESLSFECGHYFSRIIIKNNSFLGGDFPKYDEIVTSLSEKDYNRLIAIDKENEKLGYSIKENDARYKKGKVLKKEFDSIIAKLDNDKLFEDCLTKNYDNMRIEYPMNDEEFDEIVAELRNYDMPDSSKVAGIDDSLYDFGVNEITSCENIPNWLDSYIDYERYGEDALGDRACELSSGRVLVFYN